MDAAGEGARGLAHRLDEWGEADRDEGEYPEEPEIVRGSNGARAVLGVLLALCTGEARRWRPGRLSAAAAETDNKGVMIGQTGAIGC